MTSKQTVDLLELDRLRKKIKDLEFESASVKRDYADYLENNSKVKNLKKAKEKLEESHAGLRMILEYCPFGISIISKKNPDKRLFVNTRMKEMFGFETSDDMLHFSASESYVNSEDIIKMRHVDQDGNFQEQLVMERYRKDQSRWWCELYRRQAIFEGEDVIIAWHSDITKQKRAEIALNDNSAKLQAIFDNTPLNMNLKDTTGRYQLINKIYAEWYGLTPEEIIGKRASEFFFDEPMADKLNDIETAVLKHGKTNQYEVKINGKDGKIFDRQVIKFPVISDDGKINSIGTIAIDITEHKESERKLLEAKKIADDANLSKSEFLALMSHELRTPLNAIIGFTECIQSEIFGPVGNSKYQDYLEYISSSGQHLLNVINDILDLSRVEAGKAYFQIEPFNPLVLIDECLGIISGKMGGNRSRFTLFLDDLEPEMHADPKIFRQILINLLSNAVKYSEADTNIRIEGRTNVDGSTEFSIIDSGRGIPEDDLEMVLEPFGQSRFNHELTHEGTGLGLALSKKQMEEQNGSLTLLSTVGEGTTVIFKYPPPSKL